MIDPEIEINKAFEQYKQMGYSDEWIREKFHEIICKEFPDMANKIQNKTNLDYVLTEIAELSSEITAEKICKNLESKLGIQFDS